MGTVVGIVILLIALAFAFVAVAAVRYLTREGAAEMGWFAGGALLLAGLYFLLLSVRFLGFSGIPYSEGDRLGVVFKLSQKGFLWKTFEGEMALGVLGKDAHGVLTPATFSFSVADPVVAGELVKAAESGARVRLHYRQYLLRGYHLGKTSYDIVGVDLLGEER